MTFEDIVFGSALVPAHTSGGWALPGGGRTTDPHEAVRVAAQLARLIDRKIDPKGLNRTVINRTKIRQKVELANTIDENAL